MGSINYGKAEVVMMILNNVSRDNVILDVGACDGKWHKMLGGYYTMDAVEIFTPSIEVYGLESKYRKVFNCDIKDLKYKHYGCVVFGDIIEHMKVEDAQKTLEYAKKHAAMLSPYSGRECIRLTSRSTIAQNPKSLDIALLIFCL